MSDALIRFDRATLARAATITFRDLSWTLHDGEAWAVVGPVASGKTSFAEALLGRLTLRGGEIEWPLVARRPGATFAADVIRLVAFKEESRLFTYRHHYYQERFNFSDPLEEIDVRTYLTTGTHVSDDAVQTMAARLGIAELLGASFITLSNGQVRRARIARGLLLDPELLLLDEPYLGLDVAGRAELTQLLGELVQTGHRIVLFTRPEFVPDWATHVLELDQMTVRWQGPRSSYVPPPSAVAPTLPTSSTPVVSDAPAVLELADVTVRYGTVTALDHVSWTVRQGERWALLGPNGSGKSTLLSLLCGDHPQAYANVVKLFGQRRGTGESIWDVKRRIGLVSPELHLYFTEPVNALQAAATGFHDVMASRPVTPDQAAIVRQLFDELGLGDVARLPFQRLSTGQQRLVLLVRALVKTPELLILDEPFQGLDQEAITRARDWLDRRLSPTQTVIFVTHDPSELPRSIGLLLRLDRGRVVS